MFYLQGCYLTQTRFNSKHTLYVSVSICIAEFTNDFAPSAIATICQICDVISCLREKVGEKSRTKPVCQASSGFWAAEMTTSEGRGAKADQCSCLDGAISLYIPKSEPMMCISKYLQMRVASNIADQLPLINLP